MGSRMRLYSLRACHQLQIHFPTKIPHSSRTPPAGDQEFKFLGLWVRFLNQTTTVLSMTPYALTKRKIHLVLLLNFPQFLTVSMLFHSPKTKISFETQDNLLSVNSCKIKDQITCFQDTDYTSPFQMGEWRQNQDILGQSKTKSSKQIPNPLDPYLVTGTLVSQGFAACSMQALLSCSYCLRAVLADVS